MRGTTRPNKMLLREAGPVGRIASCRCPGVQCVFTSMTLVHVDLQQAIVSNASTNKFDLNAVSHSALRTICLHLFLIRGFWSQFLNPSSFLYSLQTVVGALSAIAQKVSSSPFRLAQHHMRSHDVLRFFLNWQSDDRTAK